MQGSTASLITSLWRLGHYTEQCIRKVKPLNKSTLAGVIFLFKIKIKVGGDVFLVDFTGRAALL